MADVLKLDQVHGQAVVSVTVAGGWGGPLLRPGDELVLQPRDKVSVGELVVLHALGFGRPMLARTTAKGWAAEPGLVPVLPARWSEAGRVVAVRRTFERGSFGAGPWFVVSSGGSGSHRVFGWLDRRGLEALLRSMIVRRDQAALAAGSSSDEALGLLRHGVAGTVVFAVDARPEGKVPATGPMQLGLFGDSVARGTLDSRRRAS